MICVVKGLNPGVMNFIVRRLRMIFRVNVILKGLLLAIFAWDQTDNAFYLHYILSKKFVGNPTFSSALVKNWYCKNHDIWKAAEDEHVLQNWS